MESLIRKWKYGKYLSKYWKNAMQNMRNKIANPMLLEECRKF